MSGRLPGLMVVSVPGLMVMVVPVPGGPPGPGPGSAAASLAPALAQSVTLGLVVMVTRVTPLGAREQRSPSQGAC